MNEENNRKDVERPFVVDGIREFDNPLPPWWVWLFNATIAFGVIYLLWLHMFGWNHLDDELAADRAEHSKQLASQANQETGAEDVQKSIADPQNIAAGKAIFTANCAPCHGQAGEGGIGPNLTDRYWLHGGKPEQIVNTITQGVPAKGMVAWGPILGSSQIVKAAAFVVSLQGSNPPNAKAPQGEEMKP